MSTAVYLGPEGSWMLLRATTPGESMKRSRTAKNLTMAPDVRAIVDEQPEASEYVSALVRDAERRWRAAHDRLRADGWASAELLAACEALNGYGLVNDARPATWAAADLADAETLNGVAAKWGVPTERWRELAGIVAVDEVVARCLVDLAGEFWRMNPRVERALGWGT